MDEIPIGVVISFGFFTVILAITGVSWTLQRQRAEARREAAALRQAMRAESATASESYEKAVAEAIRRDPSLARTDDPGNLRRLADAVADIQSQQRLIAAVETTAANQADAEQRAAREAAEQLRIRLRHEERAKREEERQRRLQQIPRWRRWWHAQPVAATTLILMGAGAAALLGAGAMHWRADAQQTAAAAQQTEREQKLASTQQAELKDQMAACDPSIPTAELHDPVAVGRAWLTCEDARARATGLTLIGPTGYLAFDDQITLAKDPDPQVRRALTQRDAVYGPAEEILALDPDPAVREGIARTASSPVALRNLAENLTEPVRAILLSRGGDIPDGIQRLIPPACVQGTTAEQISLPGTVWKELLDRDYVQGYRFNRDCTVDVQRWYRSSLGVDRDPEKWNQSGTTVTMGDTQWNLSGRKLKSGSRTLSLVTNVKTDAFGGWSIP